MKFKLIIKCNIFEDSKRIILVYLNKDEKVEIYKSDGYCQYKTIAGEQKKVLLDIREIKYHINTNMKIIENAISEGKKQLTLKRAL